jgi:hypothetical protein
VYKYIKEIKEKKMFFFPSGSYREISIECGTKRMAFFLFWTINMLPDNWKGGAKCLSPAKPGTKPNHPIHFSKRIYDCKSDGEIETSTMRGRIEG